MNCQIVEYVPPESVVNIDRRSDNKEVISRLLEIPDGGALKLSFESESDEGQLLQSIRISALRYGIKVAVRHVGGVTLLIRKSSVPRELPKMAKSARDRQIVARLHEGEKYESIANSFGLTRQRIEQIGLANNLLGRRGYKIARAEEAEAILAPYFERCGTQNTCHICREKTGSGRNVDLCVGCRKTVRLIRTIKSRLAIFKSSGDARQRNAAFYLIRKHGVKPEDLERY